MSEYQIDEITETELLKYFIEKNYLVFSIKPQKTQRYHYYFKNKDLNLLFSVFKPEPDENGKYENGSLHEICVQNSCVRQYGMFDCFYDIKRLDDIIQEIISFGLT